MISGLWLLSVSLVDQMEMETFWIFDHSDCLWIVCVITRKCSARRMGGLIHNFMKIKSKIDWIFE